MVAVMQQAIPWAAYLPYLVARALVDEPDIGLAGRERRLNAVVLFADISGFTAISEALARKPGGAEELTDLINAYLAPAIALVEQYGGSVGKLGGDALTAVFPYDPGRRSEAARRAAACALEVQDHVTRFAAAAAAADRLAPTMRIGLAEGPLLWVVVGSPGHRLELVLSGAVLARAAAAERAATVGSVVATTGLLADLDAVDCLPCDTAPNQLLPQFYQIKRLHVAPDPAPLPPLGPLPAAALTQAAAFLPPPIARRLENGQSSFVNEHRPVAVLFAAFAGPDTDHDPQAAAQLQAYLAHVFQVVRRYGGSTNKVDLGEKGCTFLVIFGAPTSHDDDGARALHCALELRELDAPNRLRLRVGITAGAAYCGEVGSATHREYTVIGDTVNMAARLMEVAVPGQILVAEAARRAAGPAFTWDAGELLQLRGRSAAVQVSPLLGANLDGNNLPAPPVIVGRSTELAQIDACMARMVLGNGQVLAFVGEAGIGKSTLAQAALATAGRHGARALRGECLSFRADSSYLVWRDPLRSLLRIDPHASTAQQLAQLRKALAALDPRFSPRVPLLAVALGLPAADNPLTADLTPKERKIALESLVLEVLARVSAETPLALVLESCDWIDPLSVELLETVVRRIANLPVLLLLTYRNRPEHQVPLFDLRLPYVREVHLREFDDHEAGELVDLVVSRFYGPTQITPPELKARVITRAQGNPFYIEELIGLAYGRRVDLDDPAAITNLELPGSLHNLILSRIDRLSEDAQMALKVASVIGREFSPQWLGGVYPPLARTAQLGLGLDELRRSELAILGRDGSEPAYLFKHILTREVAYNSLARSTRADLHDRVGAFIEQQYPDDLERHLDLLAHHYSLSDNQIKQREYLARAGEAAYAGGAAATAVGFFRKLLPLLHRNERGGVLLRLGMAYRLSGDWKAAEEAYREALAQEDDPHAAARARNLLGELYLRRGDYGEARLFLEQARDALVGLEDQAGANEASEHLGVLAFSTGDHQSALATFEQAIERAQRSDDRRRVMQVLNNIGAIHQSLGDNLRAQDCFERCLSLAAALGSRRHIGVAVGNLGNLYADRGDYGRAIDCYGQKIQCAIDVGDRLELGISIHNLGTIYESQGEYARAETCYLRALDTALELGDRMGIAVGLWGLGTVALGADKLDLAEACLHQSAVMLQSLDADEDLAPCLLNLADLAYKRRDLLSARVLLTQLEPLAEASFDPLLALRCRLRTVIVERELGRLNPVEAAAEVEPLLTTVQDVAARADVLYTLVRVDGARAEERTEAARIYRALHAHTPNVEYRRRYAELMGVTLPPPPPLPSLPAVIVERRIDADDVFARLESSIWVDV